MKKFLTFFAMLFALLGFSPAIHADWTFYVDTSNNGWSDAYIQVGNGTAWYSDYHGNVVPNTNGKVYKFDVPGWSDLTRIHFAPTSGHSTQSTDGTNGNGSYTISHSENLWKAVNNRCYVLNASTNGSSAVIDNYSSPKEIDRIVLYSCSSNGDVKDATFVTTDNTTWTATTKSKMADNADSGYWNATFFFRVNYTDGSHQDYAKSSSGKENINFDTSYPAVKHNGSGQHGVFVNNCKGKKITFTLTTAGGDVKTLMASEESNPPYIYIDSTCKPFEKDGSNWVYTIDATSGDKDFRIQNKNDVSATPGEKIQFGCEGGMTIDATATKSIKLYVSGNHKWTAKKGAQYVLEIPTSTAIPTEYNIPINLKITKKSVSQPPYILMEGASACEQFVSSTDGNRWEYKIENAAKGAKFRLQIKDYTGDGKNDTVLYGSTTSIGKTTSSLELWLYGNEGGYFTINDAGTYVISFDKTENLASTSPNGPHTLYVVFTETKPATPVLPENATDNKIVIPAISGAQIYYTETAEGDPSTSTWTLYPEGGIPVENHHMTIRAAAYKAELGDKAWSDVTAKTYAYVVNVEPTITIDVHTGIATITADLSKIPASANAVIVYSCNNDAAPYKKYTAGTEIDMATECAEFGSGSYPIKALVRAWGGGDDYTTKVENQTIDGDVRNEQWVGPAAVRRICLWSYGDDGKPVRLTKAEFTKQADGSYTLSYSPVSGTDISKANQRYFIRVVMNHDEPNDVVSDTGGTFYSLSSETNGVTTVASGVESSGYHNFTPSASDVRGMFFAGTDRDLVNLTLKGVMQPYTISGTSTECSRFVPTSMTPEWNPEASIKSVELRDANNKLLCTLTQNTGTGETNYWTGITTEALPKAADNSKDEKFHFVAETKDGTKYYSLGSNSNYWLSYGLYDETTSPKPSTSSSSGYYFCVNETSAIAQVAIAFDGTTASKISISPYTDTKKMDISGDPQAPAIYGYGSEVGSWDNARDFNRSETLGGWVYTFTATQSTGEYLIRGSKGNLYAPIGLQIGSLSTTVWRQVPDGLDANGKAAYAAKLPGLQVGASYRLLLKEQGADVMITIEPLGETVRKIKKVELINSTQGNTTVGELTFDADKNLWSFHPLKWEGNPSNGEVYSDSYYLKATVGLEGGDDSADMIRYVGWSATVDDYQCASISQYTNKPVTYAGLSQAKTFKVRVNGDYYVQVAFDETTFQASWLGVSTTELTPTVIPTVNRVAWSLSDDNILPRGETKYFYMSAIQNDNRLSPEWELIKQANGTYKLDNFVVVPAAQFIIRGVTKSTEGSLSVTDWGYVDCTDKDKTPYHIYATTQDFNLDKVEGLTKDSKISASFPMTANRARGFFWNIGTSMVSLVFDPSASDNQLTATIDFSYPSTLKEAPIHGFPWVGLTSSNIQAFSGSNQTYQFTADLGHKGISDSDLANIGVESSTELQAAFTNAFIQWTQDGKPYIYDRHVSDKTADGKCIYYFDGDPSTDNRATTGVPEAEDVMNSTILPPRTAPQFKMISTKGVTTPDADALTFKYVGEETKTFTDKGNTTRLTKFAVYEIENIELQGMFKVFTGYGARTYGAVANGLSWFANWGVGKAESPYSNILIDRTVSMPMNGGGQIIKTDNDKEISQKKWNHCNLGNSGDFDEDDNAAGQYFRLDNAQYVSKLRFYLALESDTEDRNSTTFHNVSKNDQANIYNDGRNYSWLDIQLEAERPVIQLNKQGSTTGVARYWLNTKKTSVRPAVKSYTTKLVKIDPDTYQVDAMTGEMTGVEKVIVNTPHPCAEPYKNYIDETTSILTNLEEGTYVAVIYDVVYETSGGVVIKETDKWNVSHPITIFTVKQGEIRGQQRVGEKNGAKVYHPIVRVTPDIQPVIKALPTGVTLAQVSAKVTVGNLRADSEIFDTNGIAIEKKEAEDPAATDIYYVVTKNYVAPAVPGGEETEGVAEVYYPKGYLTADRAELQEFVVFKSRLNALTHLKLEVAVEGAESPAPVTAEVMTYMPAGKLYGTLVADKIGDESSDEAFNALAVSHQSDLPAGEAADGYARIRYVDRNAGDAPCYIGSMDGTGVFAQVYYVSKDAEGNEVETPLFDEDSLLDMKANPDDDIIYTAKRLKIGGIPYQTEYDAANELSTDVDGSKLKLRKAQSASFKVRLTYKNEGINMPVVNTRDIYTELEYSETNLTSPRQGLRDVLTQADVDERNADAEGSGVAKDVTAVSESFIEKYGGLYTNIEDAHVALHAVPKNDALIGRNSLRQWYMDHGDKWPGTEDVNPFNPNSHLAVGNAKADGSSYSTPDEVHPMLRSKVQSVASRDDFRNDSELNNAWWNHNALVAPEFHTADQIKGTLTIEGGKVTGFTPDPTKRPKNHRAFWAGVKADNSNAYKVWDGGYILKAPEGFDVDIRDPKHGYYGQSNHFSKERSGFYHGEMPLNLNDIVAVLGKGKGAGTDAFETDDRTVLYDDAQAVYEKAKVFHPYDVAITEAVNEGLSSVNVPGKTYPINWNQDYIWDYDPIYAIREQVAFEAADGGKAPADALFEAAGHMFFKVRHVNHESWFVPGANVAEGDLKTQPLWPAFKDVQDFPASGSAKEKDEFVMNQLRMNFSDYCPLAYDVRYTYPFLTSDQYVTAENYQAPAGVSAARKARNTAPGAIADKLATVTYATDVTDVVARDKGRVSFFGASKPNDVVPTAISDVNDDIRGKGFSIVYNRAAGTVTVKAEGKKLENAAVYDATGASLVAGAKADRIDENTIVLDVRNIARGAYVVGTNLGGAKFMK